MILAVVVRPVARAGVMPEAARATAIAAKVEAVARVEMAAKAERGAVAARAANVEAAATAEMGAKEEKGAAASAEREAREEKAVGTIKIQQQKRRATLVTVEHQPT